MEAELRSIKALLEMMAKSKQSIQLIVSDNKSEFRTQFDSPIRLDPDAEYEIALVNIETYFSFQNVHDSNNSFHYTLDGKIE